MNHQLEFSHCKRKIEGSNPAELVQGSPSKMINYNFKKIQMLTKYSTIPCNTYSYLKKNQNLTKNCALDNKKKNCDEIKSENCASFIKI